MKAPCIAQHRDWRGSLHPQPLQPMKRIPRQVPAARTSRPRGTASPHAAADLWPSACTAAGAHMLPHAAALLDRLRHERDLRLERGLISEASGIELAMRLICETSQTAEALTADHER